MSHTYPLAKSGYTITMKQTTPFGVNLVSKEIQVPFENVIIYNPKGRAFFQPLGGNWSTTPISYDYIFTGDSNTDINDYYSYNYTTVPFIITGYTESTLNDISQFGQVYT
mgnify:CR=1 FL=1